MAWVFQRLLYIRMPSAIGESRAEITRNEWLNVGGEGDIERPTSANRLRTKPLNGDLISTEFFALASVVNASKSWHSIDPEY